MKQLRNKGIKRILKGIKKLPLIEWGENYCPIDEESKGSGCFVFVDKYVLDFEWLVIEGNRVIISGLQVWNRSKGFEYDLNDKQWSDIVEVIENLFNLEEEEHEPTEFHAFNLGD